MNKHVPEDGGTVRSSGYGLMVVKTTDSAADAEQIALSGASRRLSTPKSVRHGAVGAQNRRRHPPRPPGKAAASLRTISAKIDIYMRGKSSRWGNRCVAPRQATPRTSTRLGTQKHGGGDAKSPVTVVVAATAAVAATQSHPASILPNRTQG